MNSCNKPEPELVLETWGNAGKQRYSSFAHLNLPAVNPLFIQEIYSAHLVCANPWGQELLCWEQDWQVPMCRGKKLSRSSHNQMCDWLGRHMEISERSAGTWPALRLSAGFSRDLKLMCIWRSMLKIRQPQSLLPQKQSFIFMLLGLHVDWSLTIRSCAWLGGFGLGCGLGSGLLLCFFFWTPGWMGVHSQGSLRQYEIC